MLEDFKYDDDYFYDDEEELDNRDVKSTGLVDHIRYKLIKQVSNPIKDNWIEQEYHWCRRQLGQARADKFWNEYEQ